MNSINWRISFLSFEKTSHIRVLLHDTQKMDFVNISEPNRTIAMWCQTPKKVNKTSKSTFHIQNEIQLLYKHGRCYFILTIILFKGSSLHILANQR